MKSLYNALRFDGILVSQLGENVQYESPGSHYSSAKQIEYDFMEALIGYGFDRMDDYTESHGGFMATWMYKILFKCGKCTYPRWHANPAVLQLNMKRRSMPCVNDCNLFKYFDDATMTGYQYISRINENAFCRDLPEQTSDGNAVSCQHRHGYDPEVNHYRQTNTSFFHIGSIENVDAIAKGLFLPKNISYVALDELSQNILILPATTDLIQHMSPGSLAKAAQLDTKLLKHRWSLWNDIFENFTLTCHYWGSSCYYITFSSLRENDHSPYRHSHSIRSEMLSNSSLSFASVIYNPYISRNHLNFQWINDQI
jgi:hypothetical protein